MKNPNALISMALVSKNGSNPYSVYCEYIKYCIFSQASEMLSIAGIRTAVGEEFGIYIPFNIVVKCLSIIADEGIIELNKHQVKRIGVYDTNAFDNERDSYRETETKLIQALVDYVHTYGRDWKFNYAREQLIKVLDKSGLAYDVFVHGKLDGGSRDQSLINAEEIDDLFPDEDAPEDDAENQPLYTDSLFVGRFIDHIVAENEIYKNYLLKICEGLMLCAGTYQLPTANAKTAVLQIKNTGFYFDTRLLLRFVGCAGNAAVEAAKELVELIVSKGGKIYYYPQTLEEMNRAFDDAIQSLSNNYPPRDEEMRLYALQVKNCVAVLQSKKANLEKELANANIFVRPHESFTEKERIDFGFDRIDLQQYMESKLQWERRTIENDAYSLWETHMKRKGNYSKYFGSSSQLPIFVTTNSRLIGVSLEYRGDRQYCSGINDWKPNRLPVITDVRLTCRLWIPSEQKTRLALLYLTSNAVAAQRPTRRYLNTVRELAIELENSVPEYSEIPLPSFFEDNVTSVLLKNTLGNEEKFDIGTFASSISELSEWKAREQEALTKQACIERDNKTAELNQQKESIIRGAIDSNKNKLGGIGLGLRVILFWPFIVALIFAGVGAVISLLTKQWRVVLIAFLPIVAKGFELLLSSKRIEIALLKWYFPKAVKMLEKRIDKHLRQAELPYRDSIIQGVKEETALWAKCQLLIKG